MKHLRFLILLVIFILLLGFYVQQNSLLFVYVNPQTDTSGMKYSAKTIMEIGHVLDKARMTSRRDHVKYNYEYYNPYGSGFLPHNPIPNDLDLEVGINLGEFTYDGNNGEKVAQDILNAIENFSFAFNFCLNSDSKNLYTDISPFDLLENMTKVHKRYKRALKESLDYVVSGKNHIKYVSRIFNNKKYSYRVDYPYYLSSNEMLLTGYPMVKIFSDNLYYNKTQKRYLREITLIPNYFITLKYLDKSIPVEISPESFFGARLQMKRRFFATSVYANKYSENFLKNTEILNDDEKYFFFRMLSFRRHLLEVENIKSANYDRPLKIFKRLSQTANTIQPVLGEEKYNEIINYVESYLNNRDLQLLNECANIYGLVYSIQKAPVLLVRLNSVGKMEPMYTTAEEALQELYARGVVDKKYLDVMKSYHEKKLRHMSKIKYPEDVYLLEDYELCDAVKKETNAAVRSLIKDGDKIDKFINNFNDILVKAGYHRTYIYWLDENTLGILKDSYTEKIKDIPAFAKSNDLTAIEYKLITEKDIPESTLKYEVWTRYNPTPEEEKNFQQLKKALLDDKKNYNIKSKRVILPF